MKYLSLLCLSIYLLTACNRPADSNEYPEKIMQALKDADHVKMWPEAYARLHSKQAAPADYFRAAILSAYLDKREEGVQIMEKGLAITRHDDPFYIPLLILRAAYYRSESKFTLAIKDLDTVLDMEPRNLNALLNRAELADVTGDLTGAIYLYQVVLKSKPQDSMVFNNLAFYCAEAGYNLQAVEYAEKGLALAKGDETKAMLLNNMGLAIGRSGDIERGLQKIESSLSIYPNNSYAWRNKGILLILQGKTKAACQSFATASARDSALVENYIKEYCRE